MTVAIADAFDSYVNWLVLFLLLTAVNLSMEAGAYLVDGPTAHVLNDWATWPSRFGGLSILVALFVWVRAVRRSGGPRARRLLVDSWVTETVKRAAFVAFMLTVCVVAFLDIATNHTELPADFFIKLPGVALTAGFSISFFLFNRGSGDESSDNAENQ